MAETGRVAIPIHQTMVMATLRWNSDARKCLPLIQQIGDGVQSTRTAVATVKPMNQNLG